MATIQRFEDIEAWQQARELTQAIYKVSSGNEFGRDFGLRDQIRRACVSIMSNIAEGFERDGTGEFIQFLSIAKGSVGEVRAQLYVALDQNYVSQEVFDRLYAMTLHISRLVAGFIHYLRITPVRGTKYASRRSRQPSTVQPPT